MIFKQIVYDYEIAQSLGFVAPLSSIFEDTVHKKSLLLLLYMVKYVQHMFWTLSTYTW